MTNHVGIYACVVMLIVQNGTDLVKNRFTFNLISSVTFNGQTVYYEIQVDLRPFKTFLTL